MTTRSRRHSSAMRIPLPVLRTAELLVQKKADETTNDETTRWTIMEVQ